MNSRTPIIRIPASALHELEQVEQMDWGDGVSLEQLIGWINEVVARFRPDGIGEDSRTSGEFTARTFRHYQTLGCIDTPRRSGQRVYYGFRHYLQGLVIRKLLWERVGSDNITALMAGRTTAQLKQLLLEGIVIVPRHAAPATAPVSSGAQFWQHIAVVPGLEIHLRDDLPKPKSNEIAHLLALIENALRNAAKQKVAERL